MVNDLIFKSVGVDPSAIKKFRKADATLFGRKLGGTILVSESEMLFFNFDALDFIFFDIAKGLGKRDLIILNLTLENGENEGGEKEKKETKNDNFPKINFDFDFDALFGFGFGRHNSGDYIT